MIGHGKGCRGDVGTGRGGDSKIGQKSPHETSVREKERKKEREEEKGKESIEG